MDWPFREGHTIYGDGGDTSSDLSVNLSSKSKSRVDVFPLKAFSVHSPVKTPIMMHFNMY